MGGVAVAVHALAAALWCGTLAALVLTVDHRGQWARVLPRFSQMSLPCVAALLAAGAAGAVLTLDSPAQLYGTGYGRVLSAKVVVTAALVVLAWRNRTRWLPAASSHRATAVYVAVTIVDRTGNHGRGADLGRGAGSHRLARYPTWHDGSHCRIPPLASMARRTRNCKGAARWQTSRIDPTKSLTTQPATTRPATP